MYRNGKLCRHVRVAHPTRIGTAKGAWILPRSTARLKRRLDIAYQPYSIFIYFAEFAKRFNLCRSILSVPIFCNGSRKKAAWILVSHQLRFHEILQQA
jgi:hypothetical protein